MKLLVLGIVAGAALLAVSRFGGGGDPGSERITSDAPTFEGYVYDASGTLVGPVEVPRVVRSDAAWRELLTKTQYRIVRQAGTERAGTGALLKNKKEGVYGCVACGLPLFASKSKFESGTGWPSFYEPIAPGNVAEKRDATLGMVRTEILCPRCDGHLGHVFNDGPRPTGLRYCLNSESLRFTPMEKVSSLADPAARMSTSSTQPATDSAPRAAAIIAGGCFWCVEAVFEELDGVIDAVSGYAGGTKETADYKSVCTGRTKHAEAVKIIYDPTRIGFDDLLRVHFATHDPTQLNRQGADVGPQYRSAIFYANEQEKALAKAFIADLTEQKIFSNPIVTTLEPLTEFFPAEPYHQNYVCNNPLQGYVRGVALPKVEKVRKQFKDKLKKQSPLDQPVRDRP